MSAKARIVPFAHWNFAYSILSNERVCTYVHVQMYLHTFALSQIFYTYVDICKHDAHVDILVVLLLQLLLLLLPAGC